MVIRSRMDRRGAAAAEAGVSARSALANSASERRSSWPTLASLRPPPSVTSRSPRG